MTGIVYVPGGVADALPEPFEPLLVPPPEAVQLEIEPAIAANSTIRKMFFRRLIKASGNSNNPQVKGSMRHPAGLSANANPGFPVEIPMFTFPVAPALTVVVVGLKRHSALAGSVPQV